MVSRGWGDRELGGYKRGWGYWGEVEIPEKGKKLT